MQGVARAADVLRALMPHQAGLTLAQLSGELELPKSSVHRLVAALNEEGLVSASKGGRVRLGPLMFELANATQRALGEELYEAMHMLAKDLEETVDLAVLDGDSLRFVAQVPGRKRLSAVSAVGARFPLHCTSTGKLFLARMRRDRASDLLPARLPRLTQNTITSRKELWGELDRSLARGYGIDREEHHEGIAAIGTLLRDELGSVAGISVPMWTQRFYGHEKELAARLMSVCEPLLALPPR
jgi:DNA-binding IclR family transcriptional regulator